MVACIYSTVDKASHTRIYDTQRAAHSVCARFSTSIIYIFMLKCMYNTIKLMEET